MSNAINSQDPLGPMVLYGIRDRRPTRVVHGSISGDPTQPNRTHGSTQPMDNSEAHPGSRNQCNASVYRRYGRTKCFVVKTASLLYKFTPGCSLKANGLLKSSEIWVAGYGYILRLASVLNRCFDLFFLKKAESTCSGLQ